MEIVEPDISQTDPLDVEQELMDETEQDPKPTVPDQSASEQDLEPTDPDLDATEADTDPLESETAENQTNLVS